MVWQHGCVAIIMVTELVEGGKTKCHKYWPDEDDGEVKAFAPNTNSDDVNTGPIPHTRSLRSHVHVLAPPTLCCVLTPGGVLLQESFDDQPEPIVLVCKSHV